MIKTNVIKAKEIAHEKRRTARAVELAPLDTKSTIPLYAEQAEIERQAIRDKYALTQNQIDSATTTDELKTIISEF